MRILGIAGIILVASGAALAQTPVFRAAPKYGLPGSIDATFYAKALAVADIGSPDGPPDGNLDLVTANSNLLAPVLFGDGQGHFGGGPNNPLGVIPNEAALVLADFDGDGAADLLVGDIRSVVFLKGNNNGTFQAAREPIPAGRGPAAIAAAHLNGDSRLDAIIVNDGDGGAGTITILLGNGDGTFGPATAYPVGLASAAVALGDFNGDGKTDLAVANNGSDNVSILLGNGLGGFTAGQTIAGVGAGPGAIGAQDLNGDGQFDLVVVNTNSDNVAVVDGVPDGTFRAPRLFVSGTAGSTPNGLALADFNLDGNIDVAVSNNRSFDVSILPGDGHGNLGSPRAFVADQDPLTLAATDLNADGIPDVVTVNRGSQTPNAAVLLGQGDGTLAGVENVVAQPNPSSVLAGDVDNDGVSDLLVGYSAGNTAGFVLVFRAKSETGFAPPETLQVAGDAAVFARGDFNGDGRLDVAVVNRSTMNVSVFLARARGGFNTPRDYPIGAGAAAVVAGDWNGDHRFDLAVARQGNGTAGAVDVLVANADGSFRPPLSFPIGTSPVAIDTGDFDKDGKRDLVVANGGTNDLSVLLGKGDGTFQAGPTVTGINSPRSLVVADFDRDGSDDVAVALAVNRSVVVLYGNGQGGFPVQGRPLGVSGSPAAVAARDLTGDSIPDLLVTDQVSNSVSVFVSSGATRQFQDETVNVGRLPVSVAAADVDGDGRYDGAVANSFGAGTVSVLTNITTASVIRGDGNGDGRVTVADAVAVIRKLADGAETRAEDVARGTYAVAPGADANGDGVVTAQDARAVAHRLFPGI